MIGCFSFFKRNAVLSAFLIGWNSLLVGAEYRYPTNVDRINSAADSAAQKCASQFHFQPGRKILLQKSEPSDALSQYVLSRLCLGFQQKGLSVYSESDSASCGDRLVLSIVKAAVEYKKMPKRGLWRESFIMRIVVLDLAARIRFGENDYVRVETIHIQCEDQIPRSALDFVEQSGTLLGKPARPEAGSLMRYFEPVVVLSAVGWLVYSFFSIRSQ
jgi:hypothetical protein